MELGIRLVPRRGIVLMPRFLYCMFGEACNSISNRNYESSRSTWKNVLKKMIAFCFELYKFL